MKVSCWVNHCEASFNTEAMEIQKYCVRWRNRFEHIQKIFTDFFEQQVLCDVTLVSEGRRFKAHQFVLSGCSPYFRDVFGEVPAAQHPIIFLRGVTSREIVFLLEYIYKGETIVPRDLMCSFLKTCESLCIQGLCNPEQTTSFEDVSNARCETPKNCVKIPLKTKRQQKTIVEHIQPKQSRFLNDFPETGTEGPESAVATQVEGLSADICDDLNEREIIDSPPYSPQSIVFPIDVEEKALNSTMESVTILPENIDEILLDDDSIPNTPHKEQENTTNVDCDPSQPNFLENLDLHPISCESDSDDSFDELTLRLSPGEESGESEITLKQTKNSTNVKIMTPAGDAKIKAIQQAQKMRVVLKHLSGGTDFDNLTNEETGPESSSIRLSETDARELQTRLSKKPDVYCSDVFEHIDDVPGNLKRWYCRTCRRCVKSMFWKKHINKHREHRFNFRRRLK